MNYFAIIIALLVVVIVLLLFLVTNINNYAKVVVLQQPVAIREPNQILIQPIQQSLPISVAGQILLQIGNVIMHPGNTIVSLKNITAIPFKLLGYPNTSYEIEKIQITKKPYIDLISHVTTDERGLAAGVLQLKENENYEILFSGPGIRTAYQIKVYNVESHAF